MKKLQKVQKVQKVQKIKKKIFEAVDQGRIKDISKIILKTKKEYLDFSDNKGVSGQFLYGPTKVVKKIYNHNTFCLKEFLKKYPGFFNSQILCFTNHPDTLVFFIKKGILRKKDVFDKLKDYKTYNNIKIAFDKVEKIEL